VPVTTCIDSGAGSLRAAVAAANDNDIVDMSGLSCSVITLTTAELLVSQTVLTLQGPGSDHLRIDGNHAHRVLHGSVLRIYDLSIANGYAYSHSGTAAGGCIYSKEAYLTNTKVSGCIAQTYDGQAKGGGVYAGFALVMSNSTISSSAARCYSGGTASGGGARVGGFDISISSIDSNAAYCRPGGTAIAGGVYAIGFGRFSGSTISNNSSSGNVGGIEILHDPLDSSQLGSLLDSTISGNSAEGFFGGMVSYAARTNVYNSTIAFNSAGEGSPLIGIYRAPGLHVANYELRLQGALLANNTYGPSAAENDFSSASTTITAQSVHNLIRVATSPVPAGTIAGACPLLGALRNNGGATKTHALLSHSPAIDAGNNVMPLANDQRGPSFVRVSGIAPDIGAYEMQQADVVFNAAFDACP
jgi:hypothetical protein